MINKILSHVTLAIAQQQRSMTKRGPTGKHPFSTLPPSSHPPNPAHGLASVSSSALAQQGHSGNSSVGHLAKYFLICGENSPLSPTTCHSVGKDSLELTLLIPLASHPKFLFRELFLLQHLLKIAIKCKSSKGKSLLHKSRAKTLLQGIHVPLESKSHFPSL